MTEDPISISHSGSPSEDAGDPKEPAADAVGSSAQPRRTRPRWLWIAVGGVAASLLVGGGVAIGLAVAGSDQATAANPAKKSSWIPMHWDSSFTVSGDLTLTDGSGVERLADMGCQGTNGYSDIHEGTQVVITDQSGTVIATGEVEPGLQAGISCVLPFTVPSVPTGKTFYGLTVSHRGTLQYKQSELQAGLHLSLGE